MFGSLGGGEILLILVLALLLFGPRRLPQIGRTVGRAMAEFRKATNDLKSSLEQEVEAEEIREARDGLKSIHREVRDAVAEADPRAVIRKTLSEPIETSEPAESPPDDGNKDQS